MSNLKILMNGIITENPTFVLLLGMCPTLGTTSSAMNGMSMGLATMFVLICSNMAISALKNRNPRYGPYPWIHCRDRHIRNSCANVHGSICSCLIRKFGIVYPVDRRKLYRVRTCRSVRR